MTIKFSLLPLVFVASFVACTGKLPVEATKNSIFTKNLASVLDSTVPTILKTYKTPAVGIGIIENSEIKFLKVYGEHQKGKAAPKNTIFNIASITKPIVSAAVLKLVQEGNFNLDEPLYPYWVDPDIVNDTLHKRITARHCLSHSTGFKNWRWFGKNGKLEFDFVPGTAYQYSGEGMEYLRKAIENKFGMGLEKIVDSLVFKPLKMQDAHMGWLANQDTLRFAKWYDKNGDLHDINYKISKINAADDLLLTVEDLAKFGIGILNNELLNETTFASMVKKQAKINDNIHQGLGWVVLNTMKNGNLVINHDGGDPGVATTLTLFPKQKSGYILFANSDNGSSVLSELIKRITPHGTDIIEGLYWENPIPKIVDIPQKKIDDYVGTYKTDRGFNISFEKGDQYLQTRSDVFPELKIYPKSASEFFPLEFELYFRFVRENEVLKMELITSKGIIDLTASKG